MPDSSGVFVDEHQRDLAAVVDVGDLHAQLVADVDDVLDLGDALALAELGDVHQPVAARQQRDERAEVGGLDHRAEEPLADLGQLRVGDRVDRSIAACADGPSVAPTNTVPSSSMEMCAPVSSVIG